MFKKSRDELRDFYLHGDAERAKAFADKCFAIIEEGSGQDFDPVLVEVFLDSRDKVEQIHREFEH